jgi:hypothetical protein
MDAPVPINVPPHEPVYHCDEAFPPTAVNVVDAPEQIVVVPVIDEGGVAAGAADVLIEESMMY